MSQHSKIILFKDQAIRSHWDEKQEEWFFSVVDVVAALTDSANPTDYLKKIRKRDEQLGEYIGTNCPQVTMRSTAGKTRKTLAGKTAKEYKQFKGLKKENLRDNMTNKELVMNMLAELSTKEISDVVNPQSFVEHEDVAKRGGGVAKEAKLKLEAETGKKVVSSQNARQLQLLNKDKKND